MKILMIERSIEEAGGGAIISLNLAKELVKMGSEVKIATLSVDYKDWPGINDFNFVSPPRFFVDIYRKSNILSFFLGMPVLLLLIIKNSFWADLLFPQSTPSHWLGVLASFVSGRKVVWNCFEPYIAIDKDEIKFLGLKRYLFSLISHSIVDRQLSRKISKFFVLDFLNKKRVKAFYGRPSIVANPGVDFYFYSSRNKKLEEELINKYKLANQFILLSVGGLTPMKNQICLLEALSLLDIKDIKLVLVGDGPMKGYLKNMVKKRKLQGKVVFTGRVSDEEKRAWYHLCSVYLFPAKDQSWGLTPFEALCAKKLPMVSNECGAAELIGKQNIGVLINPNPGEIAKVVLNFYTQSDFFKPIVEKGYEYVKKEMSWEKYAQRIEKELKKEV